ncbi:MAG: hypothetical protein ACJA06_002500 [Halocynthiibacter sp.]|jgi:hypothetical protein
MVYYNDLDVIDLKRSREAIAKNTGPNILAVGELDTWIGAGKMPLRNSKIALAEFYEVGPDLLMMLKPDYVVSPTLCRSFDCMDLASILQASGFRGKYRALAYNLPNPEIIRREVSALCTDLDFGFFDPGVMDFVSMN